MRKQKDQKVQKQGAEQGQVIPPAMKVFSKTRDIETNNPYYLDGDMEMYSQQKLQKREQLSKDPDLRKQIENIVKMYQLQDGKILQKEYKRMQKKMALALRPDIEEEELEFVIDEDWKLDQKDGSISPQEMGNKIFELVDIWTIGVDKLEYISFTKILGKKLEKKKN